MFLSQRRLQGNVVSIIEGTLGECLRDGISAAGTDPEQLRSPKSLYSALTP